MKTTLTVAHIVPYSITFPLQVHNGRYDWVLDLATRQANRGLHVIIYSNPASHMDIPGIHWRSAQGSFTNSLNANSSTLEVALSEGDIDVYHSHFDNLHYVVAATTTKPIVFTQHWWPSEETVTRAQHSLSTTIWAVPPTQYMHEFDKEHGIITKGPIHHGIDLQTFQYNNDTRSGRLLFVGRISPEKNLPIAIAAAKKAGVGLDIIGKITPKNVDYWHNIQDSVDGTQIKYLGSMPMSELVTYYNGAAAVICPTDEHEAFGLVAIEAQACGAPILTTRGGSRSELMAEGVSGYVCSSVDEYATAIYNARNLSANDCVAFAATFDVELMANNYLTLYKQLMA